MGMQGGLPQPGMGMQPGVGMQPGMGLQPSFGLQPGSSLGYMPGKLSLPSYIDIPKRVLFLHSCFENEHRGGSKVSSRTQRLCTLWADLAQA